MVSPQNKGLFGARFRAYDIPLVIPLLPWIAMGLACTLNADKIWKFLGWVGKHR